MRGKRAYGVVVSVALAGLLALLGMAPASAATTAPGAPAKLTASNVTQTSVQLNWTKSAGNVAYYVIYETVQPNGTPQWADATSSSLEDVLNGLTPATTYTFFVKAQNGAGKQSSASPSVTITTLSPPPPVTWTDCSGGYVALTFDDGPDSNSSATANMLAQYNVRVTYFDIGDQVTAAGLAIQSANGRNVIGNHTWDHKSFTGASDGGAPMTDAQITNEIQRTNNAVTGAGYSTPTLFRYPYGDQNAHTDSVVVANGMLSIGWTADTQDWTGNSASQVASLALSATDGGVVLMHDGRSNSIAAIPQIVAGLQSKHMCPGKILPSATPQTVWDGYVFYARAGAWG